MGIITELPAGFHPEFFRESESDAMPMLRREGMTVYYPAFVRREERGGGTIYRYFEVPVPFAGQNLENADAFALASYAAIRKYFYGSQEMQAELENGTMNISNIGRSDVGTNDAQTLLGDRFQMVENLEP